MNSNIIPYAESPLEVMRYDTAMYISLFFEKYYSWLIDSDSNEKMLSAIQQPYEKKKAYEIYCLLAELYEGFIEMCHIEGQHILRPEASWDINVAATQEYKERHIASIVSSLAFKLGEIPPNLNEEGLREQYNNALYDILYQACKQAYYSGSRLTWDAISA